MINHFGDRLTEAIKRKQNPVCVGLDPVIDRMPESRQPSSNDATAVATSFQLFCRDIIDVVADLVPVVKPQAAFFEQYGVAGWQALVETVKYARDRGLLVVMDAKRGDIGNTAAAYAQAMLGNGTSSSITSDALTVNPYMGDDATQPFVDIASEHGNGLFVLVKTSNPGGKRFQDLVADGRPIYRHVAEFVEQHAANTQGQSGYGSVGAVVGATHPQQMEELRTVMPHAIFLIPGFGAQGGSADNLVAGFDEQGLGAIVNSSRSIIFAHQREEFSAAASWQQSVELATREMIQQLAAVTSTSNLR